MNPEVEIRPLEKDDDNDDDEECGFGTRKFSVFDPYEGQLDVIDEDESNEKSQSTINNSLLNSVY